MFRSAAAQVGDGVLLRCSSPAARIGDGVLLRCSSPAARIGDGVLLRCSSPAARTGDGVLLRCSSPAARTGDGVLLRCSSPAARIGDGVLLRCSSRIRTLAPRFASASAPSRQPLKRWALEVSPFSTIRAHLGCGISVRPLDPHRFPHADRAFVAVLGSRGVGLDQVHVQYKEDIKELLITAGELNGSASIDLAAPIKSNLFISTFGDAAVQVKEMECDVCEVRTDGGDCFLHSVKSHRVEVSSNGGHVTAAGSIHGNVNVSTRGDGTVDVKKLQGANVTVSTERGLLKVRAVYAESSCISSCSGSVQLGHVHGNAAVRTVTGDAVVDGSNGFLEISSTGGSIDVYVGEGASAKLHTREGAVCVRVPPSLRAGLQLCGVSVDVSPEVAVHGVESDASEGRVTVTGYVNGEPPEQRWVNARADGGAVTVRTQSWLESLKLGS
ncbi:protein FAM185A [Brachionichthys hirsutus]|uniref:protein FAM185A n=1 Tax=Brachionichthys hirsutus TaxID=412623 RepID=UPI00360453D9